MEIEYLSDNLDIIDIRDEKNFKKSHIPNSNNISLYNIVTNYSKILDKNKEYVLVCDYGIQSKIVMKMLTKLGYHVYSLKNGYNSLEKNIKTNKK